MFGCQERDQEPDWIIFIMLATALASSWESSGSSTTLSDSSSSTSAANRRARHVHHHHHHHYHHGQASSSDSSVEQRPEQEEEERQTRSRIQQPVDQIQLQLELQHQRQQSYVYPKLQLVQIDDAWYALNQTCLQIYQQLQMCGTAQLMPVDVVPLHKLPECVRKSLSSSESEAESNSNNSIQPHHQNDPALVGQSGSCKSRGNHHDSGNDTLRIYDIMSDAAGSNPVALVNRTDSAGTDKSWWSRFFFHGGNNSGPTNNTTSSTTAQPAPSGAKATWMASCRRRQPTTQHPFQRRHRQIVQKLMEETSLALCESTTVAPDAAGPKETDHLAPNIRQESDAGQFTCIVCQSVFPTHRLLQRHRERANHFGCTVCCKSFKSCSSLQDHCELLSHWSEEDSDEDSGDDLDSDEYLFSSETSDEE